MHVLEKQKQINQRTSPSFFFQSVIVRGNVQAQKKPGVAAYSVHPGCKNQLNPVNFTLTTDS